MYNLDHRLFRYDADRKILHIKRKVIENIYPRIFDRMPDYITVLGKEQSVTFKYYTKEYSVEDDKLVFYYLIDYKEEVNFGKIMIRISNDG